MCGFLFQSNSNEKIKKTLFKNQIESIKWRGPDSQKIKFINNDKVGLLHCRLSILDLNKRSDQPMLSRNKKYLILFNGEIYNHLFIRKKLNLQCKTNSDTETVLEGFSKIGLKIFEILEGMFSIVIYDTIKNDWIAVRDSFGIKPLYIFQTSKTAIISSETNAIHNLTSSKICEIALKELRLLRRPIPGKTLYENIYELAPGTIRFSSGKEHKIWNWEQSNDDFNQDHLEFLITNSINSHLISDVKVVTLLSGGLDSSIITAISKIKKAYTVGLYKNNEFKMVNTTSQKLKLNLKKVKVNKDELFNTWRYLIELRNEPINVPNEGLIYKVFSKFKKDEKVALTGEGADEIFFGYDNIFRIASMKKNINKNKLLKGYFYDDSKNTERLNDYISDLARGKSAIEFLEDFFYQHHLPTLLRRMDFASMAASKEARVPFVDKKLISYLYRLPSSIKINKHQSKIPLRLFIQKLNLQNVLVGKKIGFSSKVNPWYSKIDEYKNFYNFQLKVLGWNI